MGDRSKAESRRAETARKLDEAKRETPAGIVVRCACCRRASSEVAMLIEMGSFLACDQCIELAARAVALRKPRGR
jgi:hypothetical protein